MNERSALNRWAGLVRVGWLAALVAACGGGETTVGSTVAPAPSPAPSPAIVCTEPPADRDGVFGATVSPSGESLVWIARFIDRSGFDLGSIGFIGTETGSAFDPNSAFRWGSSCWSGNDRLRSVFLHPTGPGAWVHGTVDASAQSIVGEIQTEGSTRTFAGGPIPGSPYDFQSAASVSAAAGTLTSIWPPGSPTPAPTLTIGTDGSATLTRGGCQTRGTVQPRSDGKNLLILSAPPCSGEPWYSDGVVLAYERSGGGRRLFAYVLVSDGWDGTELFLTGSAP